MDFYSWALEQKAHLKEIPFSQLKITVDQGVIPDQLLYYLDSNAERGPSGSWFPRDPLTIQKLGSEHNRRSFVT